MEPEFQLPIQWTYYNHRDEFSGGVLSEAVPIYENVWDAVDGLKSIIEFHRKRTAELHGNRTINIGSQIGKAQGKIPEWGNTRIFYRGHNDMKFAFLPTLLRLKFESEDEDRQFIEQGIKQLNDFQVRLENLTKNDPELDFVKGLTKSQKQAIGRHYGVPSTLLDVTASMDVAAHFASSIKSPIVQRNDSGPYHAYGIIYAFNLEDVLSLPGIKGCGNFENGFGYMFIPLFDHQRYIMLYKSPTSARIEPYTIRFKGERKIAFEFTFVPQISRMNVQNAAFLSVDRAIGDTPFVKGYRDLIGAWEIIEFFSYKVCFPQTGVAYPLDPGNKSKEAFPKDSLSTKIESIIRHEG